MFKRDVHDIVSWYVQMRRGQALKYASNSSLVYCQCMFMNSQ